MISRLIFLPLQNKVPGFYPSIPEFLKSVSIVIWTWGIHRQLLAPKQNCFCCHLHQYDSWPTFTSWHNSNNQILGFLLQLPRGKTCSFLYLSLEMGVSTSRGLLLPFRISCRCVCWLKILSVYQTISVRLFG